MGQVHTTGTPYCRTGFIPVALPKVTGSMQTIGNRRPRIHSSVN